MDNLFDNIKKELKKQIDSNIYDTWIDPIKGFLNNQNEITVILPNKEFYTHITKNYIKHFNNCNKILNIEKLKYKFIYDENDLYKIKKSTKLDFKDSKMPFSKALKINGNLNKNYNFENFIKGPSNQFAHASCLNVSENLGENYNPLFIYGSTGLGKTHLLHSIGNKVLKKKPNLSVTYISSERFMNEMIYCLRFNKMWDFRSKYRDCDLLLVDDIQFISGKKSTQEEFFHTFNALYENKKQIVITSDLFPQEISDIEERLRNRFQWGLIADIQIPDIEHRIAILHSKAALLGISINDSVAEFLANKITKNIRELEGALHRIIAFSNLQAKKITKELIEEIFENIIVEKSSSKIDTKIIQDIISDFYNISVQDIKSRKRKKSLTKPRQIAMYITRNMTNKSFMEIGKIFGGKDHTTVIHAVNKIKKELIINKSLKLEINTIKRRIKSKCG